MASEINSVNFREQARELPDSPGVYLYYDKDDRLLYVGKAASLKKRVSSYFRHDGVASPRIRKMVGLIARMETRTVASETEALLLEAQLIKEHHPYYNVAFRDDKTYPLIKITKEPFARLMSIRRRQADGARYFGPYTDAGLMHEAIAFMRRVFPLRTCKTFPKSPCLEYHLGRCLAPCVGYIDEKSYARIVADLAAFLEGRREDLLRDLKRRMQAAARDKRFEEAARVRDQMQALSSVIAVQKKVAAQGPLEELQLALKLPTLPRRIEAFDISNVFGAFTVASMVVFEDARPKKSHYRRFRIRTVEGIDDFRSMAEVIRRRYSGSLATRLPFPDLVLIDGGKGQLGFAVAELEALSLKLPAIGLAKRFEHIFLPGREEPIVLFANSPVLHLLQRLRDEAHRFAITYHRLLRSDAAMTTTLERIPGVGRRRALLLLKYFGSLERLRAATPESVAQAGRMGAPQALALLDFLASGRLKNFPRLSKPNQMEDHQ